MAIKIGHASISENGTIRGVSGEQNGIGKTENVIHYVIITDRDYNDVTHNYNISYVNGWLELT